MKTSSEGIALIKSFEGCRLKAYKCHITEKYYTIGWGHYGPDVSPNMVITQEAADKMFVEDLGPYEKKVEKYNKYNWSQNEFDALVSFCYNIGSIDQLTGNGSRDKKTIAEKMLLYVNCNGYKLPGLIRRRQAEHDLFIKESNNSPVNSTVAIPEPTLRRRCKNEKVKQLQHACNILFGKDLEEDGSFGPLTQQAIKDIQKDSGKLVIDGIYGPKTYAYFKEVAGK